jgi:uncharacterized RDD family membrane protein YckC
MNETIDTLEPVELAEGVVIRLRVAGPAVRSVAWTVDLLVVLVSYFLMFVLGGVLGVTASGSTVTGIFLLLMFVINWGYNVVFEMGRHGATPGQRMMGLKVASVTGAPVTLAQSVTRNLLRMIDFMPFGYLAGLVCAFSNRRFQRLGDLVADTVVVYAAGRKTAVYPLPEAGGGRPPGVALSAEERALLVHYVSRAGGWSDERRAELADLLQPLTGAQGAAGVARLVEMGRWLRDGGHGGAVRR